MTCPTCNSSKIKMAYEIREVYDGISFYGCRDCGTVYSRWTGEAVTDWDSLDWQQRGRG